MPSDKLLKGALSYSGTDNQPGRPVVFQFNPETMTRVQVYSEQANTLSESIRFQLVFDALEGMEQDVPEVVENGVYPQLAALEELLEQQTKLQRRRGPDWLFAASNANFLVLIYGERIIPVKIQRLNIKELLHNKQLKPIHAKVDIALRTLTVRDLRGNVQGKAALDAYKQYRHLQAQLGPVNTN